MPRTKGDHFVSFLNSDNKCNFFKRFSVQMIAIQLDTLLTALETAVEIPDLVPRAVSIVGKNINTANEEIWALKRGLFIDVRGCLVDPRDHCISWIAHLVNDPGNKIVHEDRSADVQLEEVSFSRSRPDFPLYSASWHGNTCHEITSIIKALLLNISVLLSLGLHFPTKERKASYLTSS